MIKAFASLLCIYFISGVVFYSLPQPNPWKRLQSPVNSTLRSLSFTDSLSGWVTGQNGIILHTTDGGLSWEMQNSTVHTFITDISFINNMTGWAITVNDVFPFNSIILKTNDGGVNWIAEDFQDMGAFMRTIFFFDSLNGFIGGSYIAYTSDGGSNWTKAEVDSNMVSSYPVYKFSFYNEKFGYACGGRKDVAGVVWRTTNYGLNWTAQGISPDEIFDVFVFDSLNALTLAGDPEGLFPTANIKTTDGGLYWSYEELPFFGLSFAIDFRTHSEGWSASGYKFLFTSDRGENWSEFETPDSSVVYDLQFTDSLTGFAVGEDGVVLKVTYPRPTYPQPSHYKLFQNYPNPFNRATKIKFSVPGRTEYYSVPQLVSLKIYDVLGDEVATIVNEEKSAGEYEVVFNAEGLSSGIYFYKLQSGNFIETKKMMLLK